MGQSCANHADCHNELYCDESKEFPFLSTCKRQRTSYEPCDDTFQCQNYLYCWYAAKTDDNAKCLPMYSQFVDQNTFGWKTEKPGVTTYNDYLINGQYCKSGLAYTKGDGAKCVDTLKVTQYDPVTKTDKNLT